MKHKRIGVVKFLCVFSGWCFMLTAVAFGAETENVKYSKFDKWEVSFEYPAQWKEHPADRVAMMKDYMAAEAKKENLELLEFSMITGENDRVALIITKIRRAENIEIPKLVAERNQVYKDAIAAGDVTKVNYVRETTAGGLPAVEEDVERSNGGRGHTIKVVSGKLILEASFIAEKKEQFDPLCSGPVKHFVETVKLLSNKPKAVEGTTR